MLVLNQEYRPVDRVASFVWHRVDRERMTTFLYFLGRLVMALLRSVSLLDSSCWSFTCAFSAFLVRFLRRTKSTDRFLAMVNIQCSNCSGVSSVSILKKPLNMASWATSSASWTFPMIPRHSAYTYL